MTDRAVSGVGGASALRRRVYYLSLAAGWLGVVIMQAALRSAGASRDVVSVFTASSPLLVPGRRYSDPPGLYHAGERHRPG